MIKIIVPNQETKDRMIEESRYLEYECKGIDSDRAGIMMHLYMIPDDWWIIDENIEE